MFVSSDIAFLVILQWNGHFVNHLIQFYSENDKYSPHDFALYAMLPQRRDRVVIIKT